MKKLKKEENIIILVITAISFILCGNFLQMHYSSDTYCLMKWGYFEYPSHYFLLDGRMVSTLVCYLAGILKIPYNAYIIVMDIMGIILMSLSCFILYKILLKLTKFEKTLIIPVSTKYFHAVFSIKGVLFLSIKTPDKSILMLVSLA